MVKCKQAIKGAVSCGKDICCFECENKEHCPDVCSDVGILKNSEECEEAIIEGNELVAFKSAVLAITQTIANIQKEKEKLDEENQRMRQELEQAMDAYGITSFENDYVKITHVDATTKVSVDSKKLKSELPDIYAKYSKVSDVKGYVKITVK